MPKTIVKPNPDEDWYFVWNTIVDCPTYCGTRAELEAAPGAYAEADRFERADATGSSARWGVTPEPYTWASRDQGGDELLLDPGNAEITDGPDDCYCVLPYENVREFCERWERGENRDDLVHWEQYEEGQDHE